MDLVGRQMAREIAFTLPLSKVTSQNPLKINFRCHICGDSKSDAYNCRGWFYEWKNGLRYGCFNCGYNKPFHVYLKEEHPDKYREYLMNRRRESNVVEAEKKEKEADLSRFDKVIPTFKKTVLDEFGTRLDLLADGHPAKAYMVNRKIPDDKLQLFWFTMNWRELSNKVCEGSYKFIQPEPRIVIPIYDQETKEICAIQGRALRSTEKTRYLTIKSSEDASKVYGFDRVNLKEDVFYLEGPIDSVFIDNALAIVGGNMSPKEAPGGNKRVWVLDNEPRSVDTCKRISKLIDAGERVVLWDKCPWSCKDVNDMILKEGATVEQVNQYLKRNIVSGLTARMRFNKWCKVNLRK